MASPITFAIGDIHGCYQELKSLLAVCEKVGAVQDMRFVFVGDYIDRGPDPKTVIDFLIDRQHRQPNRFVFLRGNHEQMLIDAADSGRSYRDLLNWLVNGGEQTLDSYQVDDPRAIPADHLAFIAALPLRLVDRHRLYVHAGIRPGVPLSDQSPDDLLWIREPFLSCDDDCGALVVHGHTPTESGLPDLRVNRLNIDTGCVLGGPLTAAMFSDLERFPVMFMNSLGETWRPDRLSER
jgi:serine/threonine protein phosphatase 1